MPYEHKPRGAGDLILATDWNAIGDEVQRMAGLLAQDEKKETVSLPLPLKIFGKGAPRSPLSVAGGAAIGAGYAEKSAAPENGLIVEGSVGVGTPAPAGKLNVVHKEEDASGGAVILGPTATSNLRLGYHKDYAWMQSHGGRPLKINPLGNDVSIGTGVVVQGDGDVGVGTGAPQAKLHVEGDALLNGGLTVRDDVQFGNRTRQMLNLWKQEYGIGVQGATHYFRTGGHFAWYKGGKHDDAVLNAGGGTPQMVIRDNGNVGIGTTEPGAQLHVTNHMTVGPVPLGPYEGRFVVSGKGAEVGFMRRTLTAWPAKAVAGDRYVWYNPDGTARLWTEAKGDLVTVTPDGTLSAKAYKTTIYDTAPQNAVSLASNNQWAGFPGLVQKFSLSQRSTVMLFYQVTMPYGGGDGSHLCTRLAMDGAVIEGTQSITGNTVYWSPSNLWIGEVDAGSHSVELQYRTPSGGTSTPGHDWQCRVLKVLVLGS